ncbi:tumor necrosis factor receptor superfamily member 5 isoform X2 [Kryptolebias marmoratus]|uniref:tumor necrosis factor receptor superfamily member 5 isoform X2 n=1 Tax=Kryptolebias marmoratus TaxID=37003 RepID=UPI0018ACB457|nr:tumor necrosis factor receptor superfamily member 5 isoform X2 [Kryptolebias marmoratus]
MANMNCTKHKYAENGRCCDRCPSGQYVKPKCSDTNETNCVDCPQGFFTDTENHLLKCLECRKCDHKNGKPATTCTTKTNTVCECKAGFFCSSDICDHCQHQTPCPLGKGVQVQASRTSDLKCSPCEKGTYSNVTDFSSPCVRHTRCEDIGRELKTPGNSTTDAVCGNFKMSCHWMLPAGLWAGLVLTIIVVMVAFIFWRLRRKSYRTASPRVPVSPVEISPVEIGPAVTPHDLFPYGQETCIENGCKIPLFISDNPPIVCSTEDSLDSRYPITPLKASVSFVESIHTNGSMKLSTNFCRSYSEPQEDEWCGAG